MDTGQSDDPSVHGIPFRYITHAALESSKDAILVGSLKKEVLGYNQEFLSLWGIPAAEMETGEAKAGLQTALDKLVNPKKFIIPNFYLPKHKDTTVHDKHLLKDGRIIDRYSKPLKLNGKYYGRIWWYYDITEKERAKKTLKSNLTLLNTVFEQSQDGILVLGADKEVLNYNQLYLDMFNMDPIFLVNAPHTKVIEYSLSQIHHQKKMRKEIYELMQHPKKQKSVIIEFLDGRIVERFSTVFPLKKKKNGRILFYRDITEATNRVNKLIARNYEMDRFVYSASHDLKAPLNSLMGLVEILEKEGLSESASKYLGLMDLSLHKLDLYIRGLAEYSQNENLGIGKEKIFIHDLIEDVLLEQKSLNWAQGVDFKVKVEEKYPLITDSVRVRIILKNLISNATKYKNPKINNHWVKIKAVVHQDRLDLKVADNGIGIDMKYSKRIFDQFFRATYQAYGSGLGLYTTKKTVDKLHGQIQCETKLGIGSIFKVTIPNKKEN